VGISEAVANNLLGVANRLGRMVATSYLDRHKVAKLVRDNWPSVA
jgi:hypothetical protein